MKVRVINRRIAGSDAVQSKQDNIFNHIPDVAAPDAVASRLSDVPSAQVLRPGAFAAHRRERVTRTSPSQLQGVSCIAEGAIVITRSGVKAVQDVQVGDMLLTRDNGFQPVLWRKEISDQAAAPMVVEIEVDAVDLGIPASTLYVSGRQGLLLTCPEILQQFGSSEILVRAGDLLHLDGICQVEQALSGVALMTPRHELISVNGMWVESFAPDSEARKHLTEEERDNINRLVPGLSDLPFDRSYPSARTVLRREFARQFTR